MAPEIPSIFTAIVFRNNGEEEEEEDYDNGTSMRW
jgi:hypothetical protein